MPATLRKNDATSDTWTTNHPLRPEDSAAITAWSMSEIGICTKPLARRTLPRVRGSAVGEGLRQEVSWVTEKGGPRDPTTPKDAGGTPAP